MRLRKSTSRFHRNHQARVLNAFRGARRGSLSWGSVPLLSTLDADVRRPALLLSLNVLLLLHTCREQVRTPCRIYVSLCAALGLSLHGNLGKPTGNPLIGGQGSPTEVCVRFPQEVLAQASAHPFPHFRRLARTSIHTSGRLKWSRPESLYPLSNHQSGQRDSSKGTNRLPIPSRSSASMLGFFIQDLTRS